MHYAILLYLLCAFFCAKYSSADIVKPALVEISVYTDGHYKVELRASIEAMMTGINSKYRNTKDAPNAEAYDVLRVLQSAQLKEKFLPFKDELYKEIRLIFDDQPVKLQITSIDIPEPGYTKVPRTSLIVFEGKISKHAEQLSWYYPARFSDNAVRVRQIDEVNEKWHWSRWQWLRNNQISEPFSLTEVFTEATLFEVIKEYIVAGFDHIIPQGLDHILFILGIFLLSTKLKTLAWQATMFTLAHSITLSLSMFNVISLPASIVEPLIALSIAYLGIENIFAHKLKTSRLALVFGFGLLHGMGFASVLAEFGMPESAYATALISFNIGVEIGQLIILTTAYFCITYWFKNKQHFHNYITLPGSVMIGVTGLYWTWERFSWAAVFG
ncbi:Membrane protein [hydrothermal vent metagenome]|uniref:Membrane protein n=1 Tax=hydrothermal vent metagenome TaxID=652676 RepID=A0A3B0XYN4_9ZZZZ